MFQSLAEIIEVQKKTKLPVWKIIQEDDCKEQGISLEESFQKMKVMYEAMALADKQYDASLCSASGLVGKEGAKLAAARERGSLLCGDFIGLVMEKAIKMGESNACMKRIVAAPTAGSCGVVPAVFLSLVEQKHYTQEEMIQALYVAAGVGGVIASRAFLAGASGGCQAEIGSASSMAAAGVASLDFAGNPSKKVKEGDKVTEIWEAEVMAHAAALAMKNLLGLVCDPVAGLVEVPCVKRNVLGAVNAMTSADLALCGIFSKIPPDEVFDAMKAVGRSMSEDLRETGKGGLAATPTGVLVAEKLDSF